MLPVAAALIIWTWFFHPFLGNTKQLLDDALPYYEHIKFYCDNLAKGIYPLMDPVRDFGVDNEFYLRRIGEFNPVYLLIVLLKRCGLDFLTAYHVFLGGYFLLGAAGFYCLAASLFRDRLAVLSVLCCVLFSTLSSLSAQSYLLLILVPQVWFFYFTVSFLKRPAKGTLLGVVFCVMLASITYIPYYFLIVVLTAVLAFFICCHREALVSMGRAWEFCREWKLFTCICALLLVIGMVPGILWFAQSSKAEMFVVYRHSGAETSNAAAVNLNAINEGGIIAPKVADQMFYELDQTEPGRFYLPLFFYCLLLAAFFVPIDRKLVFFFCWGFALYFIGIADAGGIHSILYRTVFFFKYFRNLQFFLWLGVFPVLVLTAGHLCDRLLAADLKGGQRKTAYSLAVIIIHAGLAWFFASQMVSLVIPETYAAIMLSACFFLAIPFRQHGIIRMLLPFLLLTAAAAQSAGVFSHMARNSMAPHVQDIYDGPYMDFVLPQKGDIDELMGDNSPERFLNKPFYSTRQFQDLHLNMNRSELALYIKPRLLLYGHAAPFDGARPNWNVLGDAFANQRDTVFINSEEIPLVSALAASPGAKAEVVTRGSNQVSVVSFQAGRLVLDTRMQQPRFLVYNNVFHSQWRVFIDGKQVHLFRANHAFMGVLVPEGGHRVVFQFQSPWRTWLAFFMEGLFLSVFAGVLYLLWRHKD